jgi:hypothetical protein
VARPKLDAREEGVAKQELHMCATCRGHHSQEYQDNSSIQMCAHLQQYPSRHNYQNHLLHMHRLWEMVAPSATSNHCRCVAAANQALIIQDREEKLRKARRDCNANFQHEWDHEKTIHQSRLDDLTPQVQEQPPQQSPNTLCRYQGLLLPCQHEELAPRLAACLIPCSMQMDSEHPGLSQAFANCLDQKVVKYLLLAE